MMGVWQCTHVITSCETAIPPGWLGEGHEGGTEGGLLPRASKDLRLSAKQPTAHGCCQHHRSRGAILPCEPQARPRLLPGTQRGHAQTPDPQKRWGGRRVLLKAAV